jgi:hypothetical protein
MSHTQKKTHRRKLDNHCTTQLLRSLPCSVFCEWRCSLLGVCVTTQLHVFNSAWQKFLEVAVPLRFPVSLACARPYPNAQTQCQYQMCHRRCWLYLLSIPIDAQIPRARSPWRITVSRRALLFVRPPYRTCFMSPCWRLEILGGSEIFGKLVHHCMRVYPNIEFVPLHQRSLFVNAGGLKLPQKNSTSFKGMNLF